MFIESCQCLCLDKRKEHWEKLEKQCLDVGIPFERFVAGAGHILDHYDYIDEVNPDVKGWGYGVPGLKHTHYSAFQCHQRMIKKAKEQGKSNVLMLEDDSYITSRFKPVWNALSQQITINIPHWDLLYLGWWIGGEDSEYTVKTEDDFNKHRICGVEKMVRCGGLHGVIINHTMYDTLLSLPANNPIDWQLNSMHSRIQSYYVYPRLIHVRSMYSETEGANFNRQDDL